MATSTSNTVIKTTTDGPTSTSDTSVTKATLGGPTTTSSTVVKTTTDGPTSTVIKTTTYETKTSSQYVADLSAPVYRPMIQPRNIIIQRSTFGALGSASGSGGGASRSVERSAQYGALSSTPSGAYANVTNTGVTAVKTSREKEKKDMQDLNERFASYIEKVRFLEAQNRRLADELEKLKAKWGKETTQIKAMYQAELDEARKCLDDADREKARLEIRVASLEEQLEELRNKLQDANRAVIEERERAQRNDQQLSDYEAEINLLRRRLGQLENDREKDKKQITTLQEALNRARVDLDNETLLHVDAENRRQTLEEELEFLKQVHEQELKELAALAYRDTTAENREFWKNEMGQALREIHQVYDDKLEGMRGELETFYNLKVQEFRTGATRQNMETQHNKEENKKLKTTMTEIRDKLGDLDAKNAQLQRELDQLRREKEARERELEAENNELKMEIVKLRAEMEAVLRELQSIIDSKLGLELEIAAYRKLLECEESRIGMRSLVDEFSAGFEEQIQAQSAQKAQSAYSGNYGVSGGGSGFSSGFYGSGSGVSGGGSGFSSSVGSGGGGVSGGGSVIISSSSFSSEGVSGGGNGISGGVSGGGSGFSSSSFSSGGSVSGGGSVTTNSSFGSATDSAVKMSQVVKGEMSAKTTYQRSAKGPVSISECSADGKFITLENTGRKDEDLNGWKLVRNIDGQDMPEFSLSNVSLQPGQKFKIWARGSKPATAAPTDLEYSDATWGTGTSIITKLVNQANEDRASHVQKTVYS